MEFFLLNVLLKVFLFLKVCDRDQVELEAMVLDYPKFYNHEYCSLVVIFHSSPTVCDENRSVKCAKYSFTVSLCNTYLNLVVCKF